MCWHLVLPPLVFLATSILSAQTVDRPVRAVHDPGVVTTRQTITPAGVPTIFQGKVYGVSFGATPAELWAATASNVYQLDWRANKVKANLPAGGLPALMGLVFDRDLYMPAVPKGKRAVLLRVRDGVAGTVVGDLGAHNTGGLGIGGGVAVVPMTAENRVAVVELSSGKLRGYIETGVAPFAAVVNREGTVAYVSNWGGRKPAAGDRTAATGRDPNSDRVVVDEHGIAATGTVTRLDLAKLAATHTIAAELHPNGVAWDERGARLYVANNNRESVTVIDTATNKVVRNVAIQPFVRDVTGIAPTAVALSPDGSRLYVACGGINAVVVIETRSLKQLGMIPAGWYPNSLAVSGDGKLLAVGALLGAGSGWRDDPRKRFVHSYRGSVHVVETPDAAQLANYTLAVSENNRLPLRGSALAPAVAAAGVKAVPVRSGDPSPIEHVVYIIKENRTYDQVFGDVPEGNGDPSLVMFGEDVTPNQHRLARQFVLLDNFYASGGNSADGHQWLSQANEVAYTLWPGYQGRSYPFDGSDPIAIARGGTIWDAARAKGKEVRVYGEYAGSLPEPVAMRKEYLARWKAGEDFSSKWHITAPSAHMNEYLARNYPTYTNSIPDQIRADIFLRDVAAWVKAGRMPNFTVMLLPSDHTFGTAPGASTPKAMVADNDLAVGRIVEELTKSPFWPKMAIFIVEDDAQNGVDHVDGHRTVALVVSPYAKRGAIDSTFYSHQSMLKTMELMMGLPQLSLFDLIANDMRASFQDVPDLAPYAHVQPKQDLFELNPPAPALRGEARRAALESAKMRWDVPDAAPSERLNRILWHSIKGWQTPFPGVRQAVFAPLSLDMDDDDR